MSLLDVPVELWKHINGFLSESALPEVCTDMYAQLADCVVVAPETL